MALISWLDTSALGRYDGTMTRHLRVEIPSEHYHATSSYMKIVVSCYQTVQQKLRLPILLWFVSSSVAPAADYEGAAAILRKVEEQTAKVPAEGKEANENSKLRQDLTEFRKKASALPPADSARGWLELVDRRGKISLRSLRQSEPGSMPVTSQEVLDALPPPAAWDELKKAIAARPAAKGSAEVREIGLRLLAATLTGNGEARKGEIAALQAKAEKADAQSVYFFRNVLEQLSEAMLAALDDPEAVLKSLEWRLVVDPERGMGNLRIPNLVSLVGMEKAEAFLRRALQQENLSLEFEGQNETSRLGQKLALEMMAQLKKPQWSLVNSLDTVELYEAMDKRFGQEKEKPAASVLPGLPDLSSLQDPGRDYQKVQAQTYYLLGLIGKQRSKDAVAVAKRMGKQDEVYVPQDALKAMERAGYTVALDEFFFELLSDDPTLPFWNDYVQLAAKAGQTERMLKLARSAAARDDLSKNKKAVIHQTLFRALLAAEQVEEGVQEMQRLMKLEDKSSRARRQETTGQLGIMLAQIGRLLQHPEWTEEGVRAAQTWLQEAEEENSYDWGSESVATSLAQLLFDMKRGAQAEAALLGALSKAVRNDRSRENYAPWNKGGTKHQLLAALALLYHQAGRPADVLALLDQAPYWGAKDLAELNQAGSGREWMPSVYQLHGSGSGLPLSYIASSALLATDRKEEALRIAEALLDAQPGSDRAYELRLLLGGDSIMARLDELFARDQFEERPLIWKAELLRRQNKLEEAEKVVRQAISIDPSDGEQGPGDRMRAYAVLADVREARGDKKEADFFREVVKAIRLSEEADKYYTAGLLKRAIPMYEDSLKHFADAYCIQSRLAVQLAELGRHAEAEAHYRRAYELMPYSFGRVESHCFGCERAFEGQRAQGMAEKVFTELAAKTPGKPQVHYLLGYLREEQERHSEALPHFQTAVRLDPDYLNAWQKIETISQNVHLPSKEHDRVVFNILRLDPLRRHAQAGLEKVGDLAGLWNAIEAGQKRLPVPAPALYPLPASKAALEKAENDLKTRGQPQRELYEQMVEVSRVVSPARAVAQTPFVRVAAEMFASDNASNLEE